MRNDDQHTAFHRKAVFVLAAVALIVVLVSPAFGVVNESGILPGIIPGILAAIAAAIYSSFNKK